MTVIPVHLNLDVDNTDRFRRLGPQKLCRSRTIDLRFTELPGGGGYEVVLYGPAFNDGGGVLRAEIRRNPADIQAAIDQLLDIWQRRVLKFKVPDERGGGFFRPYETVPADNDRQAAERWDKIGRVLARAGNTLFCYLFYTGDQELAAIADALVVAMGENEQVVSIHSDTLFAPWSMLYTPPDPRMRMHRSDAQWSPSGFWGYRHLIEHQVRRNWLFRTEIPLVGGDAVAVGMNIDPKLDDEFPRFPFIGPVQRFLDARARIIVRTRKEDLAAAIVDTGLDEHVTFFGCHGTAGNIGSSAAVGQQPSSYPALFLEDRDPIYAADLSNWFSNCPKVPGPIVYLAACEAGRIASFFYSSFGMMLLEYGANCLIGPQIDLPVGFAKEYTCRFFDEFLKPGTRIGDITRDLTREFIDKNHTPLGLIFTLHRGLDVHLGRVAP